MTSTAPTADDPLIRLARAIARQANIVADQLAIDCCYDAEDVLIVLIAYTIVKHSGRRKPRPKERP